MKRDYALFRFVALGFAACGHSSNGGPPDGAPPPSDASFAVQHVPLTGCGYSYTGVFHIGAADFRLQVDSGSHLLGVAAQGCDTCTADGVAPLYMPGATAVDQHQTQSESYANGALGWSGELYKDTVAAGTLPPIALELTAITTEKNFFAQGLCGDPQGIIGLDAALNPQGAPTNFLHELAAAGATDEFAIHYCLGQGDLWLDGYDPTATAGDPMWTQMQQNAAYSVSVSDIAADGTSAGVPPAMLGRGVIDSGGPNLLLPHLAFAALANRIGSSPAFQAKFGDASWFGTAFHCATLSETRAELDAELPKLTVKIGTPAISIDLPATASYLQTFATNNGLMYCQAMYASNFTDLGNTLMRAGIVIHDRAHGRLGFAAAPSCTDVTTRRLAQVPDLTLVRPRR
jgi:hypothetical protein